MLRMSTRYSVLHWWSGRNSERIARLACAKPRYRRQSLPHLQRMTGEWFGDGGVRVLGWLRARKHRSDCAVLGWSAMSAQWRVVRIPPGRANSIDCVFVICCVAATDALGCQKGCRWLGALVNSLCVDMLFFRQDGGRQWRRGLRNNCKYCRKSDPASNHLRLPLTNRSQMIT